MSILLDNDLLIGRQAEGAGCLAEDDEISRTHARVTIDAIGNFAIEDLGSTNGTFVNGMRISSPHTLSQGDTIELGQTTLVVREIATPAQDRLPSEQRPPSTIVPVVELPAPARSKSPPMPPGLSLRLEVDFAAREAKIACGDGSEPVRLVFEDGAWRRLASRS